MAQDEESKAKSAMQLRQSQSALIIVSIIAVGLFLFVLFAGRIVADSKTLLGMLVIAGAVVVYWAFYSKSKYKTAQEVIADIVKIEDKNGIELDPTNAYVKRIGDTETLAYFPNNHLTYGYSYIFGIHTKARENMTRALDWVMKNRVLDRIEIPKEIGDEIIKEDLRKGGFFKRE